MEKVINFLKIVSVHSMALLFVIFSAEFVSAQEISIVQVKRNITLSDDDLVFKDYYINAGDNSSLRKNMVVNIKRKITVKDNGSRAVGDFETNVGQLKIIHIGNKVSVAREFKLTPRDEEPMLEQIGIMMGDRVDLTNSFIDYSKPNIKRKTSEATPEEQKKDTTSAQTASNNTTEAPPREPSNVNPVAPTLSTPSQSELPSLLQKVIPIPSQGI